MVSNSRFQIEREARTKFEPEHSFPTHSARNAPHLYGRLPGCLSVMRQREVIRQHSGGIAMQNPLFDLIAAGISNNFGARSCAGSAHRSGR